MASYRQAYYDEVDGLFNQLKDDPFNQPLVDPLPQESVLPLAPAGWVENSQATVRIDDDGITILNGALTITDSDGNTVAEDGTWQNGPGSVVINADGITITDGALTLVDEFGSTVLTGAGFGGSWYDFISYGMYNASFPAGTTNKIIAATGSAPATETAYQAALSSDIPYWVVSVATNLDSTRYLQRVADSSAPSGYYLRWNSVSGVMMTGEIMQDVPVIPGQRYNIILVARKSGGFTTSVVVKHRFRDASRAALGASETTENATIASGSTPDTVYVCTTGIAPSGARYLRVKFSASASTTNTLDVGAIMVKPVIMFGRQYIMETGNAIPGDEPKLELWQSKTNDQATIIIDPWSGIKFQSATGSAGTQTIYKITGGLAIGTASSSDVELHSDGTVSNFPGGFRHKFGSGPEVLINTTGGNAYFQMEAASVPPRPSTGFRLYADQSGGKSRLRIRWPSGADTTVATEP